MASALEETSVPRQQPPLENLLEEIYGRVGLERSGTDLTLREWPDVAEAFRIVLALREARGNRSRAARRLGIGRRTLYTKMKKLDIEADWSL